MSTLSLLYEGNSEATIYCGNLDSRVTEEMIQELFIQAGPVINVFLPRDKISGEHQGFGFIEFKTEDDSDYAIKIMHMIKLFGKPIKLNKASSDKRTQDVGANVFVGNLDPDVDEKVLYDTFSVFGLIISTNIMRDPESGLSKGFAFIGYDNFEASDSAISSMNQQYFCNKLITVQYAYKKDTKGERHGTAAERLLAANRPNAMTKVNPSSFAQGGNQQTLHMNQNLSKNTGGISSSMMRNPPPVLFNQQSMMQPQKQMMPPGMPGMPQGMPGMPGMPQGMPGMPQGMSGMPQGMSGMPQGMSGLPQGMPGMPQGMPIMPQGMPIMSGMMPPMFPPMSGMMGHGGPMMPPMQGGFPPMPGMMGGMSLKPPGMPPQ